MSIDVKKKIGEDLVSIILFGSVARGNFDGRSDIELLIVMESDRKEDILKDIRLEFLLRHVVKMDMIVMTKKGCN